MCHKSICQNIQENLNFNITLENLQKNVFYDS